MGSTSRGQGKSPYMICIVFSIPELYYCILIPESFAWFVNNVWEQFFKIKHKEYPYKRYKFCLPLY